MNEKLKALKEYPDVDFIDGYTCEKLTMDMIGWFREKKREITGKNVTLAAADDNRILLQAGAYFIFQGFMHIDQAAKMGLLKYSTGDYLDNLGAFKRVERKKASPATTTLWFEMDETREAATPVRVGTRVTAGDGVYFATDEYAEIPIGSTGIAVSATCLISGSAGNIYAERELCRMVDNVAFIDRVYNVTASAGGEDDQDDEGYREDIYAAPDAYTCAGSEDAYKYYVYRFDSSISEVRIANPLPRVVEIMCLLDGGVVMNDEFIKKLQEYMNRDDIRMLTDSVVVKNPDIYPYDLDLTYYINASDKNRAGTIQQGVENAIKDWILWQRSVIGRDINPNELIKRVLIAGAKRVEIKNPTFTVIHRDCIAVPVLSNIIYGGLEDD